MAFDYKIYKHIATLSESHGESKQVNIISYNGSKPKIDIRNWYNGDMRKGLTLDEDEWYELGKCFNCSYDTTDVCSSILGEVKWLTLLGVNTYEFSLDEFDIVVDCESKLIVDEEGHKVNYTFIFQYNKSEMQKLTSFLNDANKFFAENNMYANAYVVLKDNTELLKITGKVPLSELSKEKLNIIGVFLSKYSTIINEFSYRKRKQVYFDNVLVVGDLFACVHQDHIKREMFILVDFVRKDGSIFSVETRASYCEKCNLFFVRTHDYHMLKINGGSAKMLCQEIEYERYCKNPNFRDLNLNDHSILNIYGYNVNAIDNLTQTQRQEILANMVDRKIVTKERIASYLAFFIKGAQRQKRDMSSAIDKWNRDRSFILDYNVGSRKKVEPTKITVIKYKPLIK